MYMNFYSLRARLHALNVQYKQTDTNHANSGKVPQRHVMAP